MMFINVESAFNARHKCSDFEVVAENDPRPSVGSSLKMEIRSIVHDGDVDEVISAIMRSARTGTVGDGHVCVTSVETVTTFVLASGMSHRHGASELADR
jgi:nitrogen regulatory protein PII